MTVPTDISALSTTRDSNVSPVATDNVFPELDDHIRALQSFVASIYANTATNGWVSPYVPKAGTIFVVEGLTSNDNSAAAANQALIQAAIDSAHAGHTVSGSSIWGGGIVILPQGKFFTTRLLMRPGVTLAGYGERASMLILANTTDTDLVADEGYIANNTTASYPYNILDITLDGNKANNTAGNCLVVMAFQCRFHRVRFQNASGAGAVVTTKNSAAAGISNGTAENRFDTCTFQDNEGGGYFGDDTGDKLADQMFIGCRFSGNGEGGYYQYRTERAAGDTLQDCRFYSGWQGDVDMKKAGITQISDCHFQSAVQSAPNTGTIFASLRIRSWGSTGGYTFATIVDNTFWSLTSGKTATDIYCAIYFDQAADGVSLTGNVFHTQATVTVKHAVHGASSMGGKSWPNVFVGYTATSEYGDAWNNWTRTSVGAAATDAATTLALANAMRAEGIALGIWKT